MLCEGEKADLDAVSVQRVGLKYLFTVPLTQGNLLVYVKMLTDSVAEIVDIQLQGVPDDHPDRFSTTNPDDELYGSGVRLGPAEVRRISRYIFDRIKQDHPELRHFRAERRTGARYASGKRDVHMRLP